MYTLTRSLLWVTVYAVIAVSTMLGRVPTSIFPQLCSIGVAKEGQREKGGNNLSQDAKKYISKQAVVRKHNKPRPHVAM